MPHTLAQAVQFELEIKHSRFLALACPVDTPAAALDFLREVAVADATHNCWAYRIGQAYRSSDDGEPAGTAGRPILAAIDGQGLDQVMVVVIRWYGGIKLGAGGLVRAYGGAAAECLRTAPRRELVRYSQAQVHCPFEHIGLLHSVLDSLQAEKLDERFETDGVHMAIRLPADHVPALTLRLRDGSRNRITLTCEPGHAP
jgi:uncharacterized YigZ family protein